jgi:F-type H+-transporting ATPase subunit alpha
LTVELFDRVPLDQMTDAERSLREGAADIPAEVCKRFDTAATLSDEDRETIIQIARKALTRFHPKTEPESKPEAQTEVNPKPELKEKL